MKIVYLTYRIPLFQNAPRISTDFLWDLTWLFLVLVAVYFAGVFYYRNRISSQSKKVGRRKTELSPMVSEFLFYEEDATNDEKSKYIQLKVEIRQLIKDDFNRRVLSEVLLDLRRDVSGDTKIRLFKLYKDLGLHKDAYKKLKSWKWHLVSKGILELTQMRVEESYSLITRFVNDKRGSIRKQAEIATVTLKYEGINYFLDNTRFKISEWQQLKLLDVIRNFEDYQPPLFKAWLTSSNRNVVLFALRLIRYYNQNDAKSSLLELVKHKNNKIKSEAIACIKEFYVVEASEILKTVFWKSTADIKIQILGVLATFGQEKDLDFLNLIDKKESNFAVKSKALSAINVIRPESILPTEGILDISKYQLPEDIVLKSEASKEFDMEDGLCEVPFKSPLEMASEESLESTLIDKDKTVPMEESGESSFVELKNEMNKNSLTEVDAITSETVEDINFDIDKIEAAEFTTSITVDNASIGLISEDLIDEDLKDIDLGFLPHVRSEVSQVVSNDDIGTDKDPTYESIANKDIFNIEVSYTEVQNSPLEEIGKLVGADEKKNVEDQEIELELSEEIKDDKYSPLTSRIRADVENIEVEFKELNPYQKENKADDEAQIVQEIANSSCAIDEIELDFLPIVVDETENYHESVFEKSKYKPSKQNNELSHLQLFDCEVEYDEVIEIKEVTAKGILAQEETPVGHSKIFENNGSLDLADFEVIFEEVCVPDKTEILKEIPKIEFYSEETLQTMSLLDDIEELGDDREIPLLLEYLEEARDQDIRNRIREIIKKFAHWEPKTKAIAGKVSTENILLEYNVLDELFRGIDLEKKLILLDAVSDIVDERDLPFLMKIKDSKEQELRNKATLMIKQLEHRLSQVAIEEPLSVKITSENDLDDSDLFKVEFEISVTEKNTNDSDIEVGNKENGFLEQLLAIPNKIIQSLNG